MELVAIPLEAGKVSTKGGAAMAEVEKAVSRNPLRSGESFNSFITVQQEKDAPIVAIPLEAGKVSTKEMEELER